MMKLREKGRLQRDNCNDLKPTDKIKDVFIYYSFIQLRKGERKRIFRKGRIKRWRET